ncbi:MAG: putative methyltransferase [Deltaproteobacteria bacterium]|nr:MAG: putative methyltransferase [Deltaproteobacteria bacterium]
MTSFPEIDWRTATNAISDVIQNRPLPLRIFDQIHMKAGDMVVQSQIVARWADGKRLAFIGDGDGISICVPFLKTQGILNYGPTEVMVYDFDERVCSAVERFADRERLDGVHATLYNCIEAFPGPNDFDLFYTNPPWGASNNGESVCVFMERGMEAVAHNGEGMVVIADDSELAWPQQVLSRVQQFTIESGFFVQQMTPRMHFYHLDDAPKLRSCNLLIKSLPGQSKTAVSEAITDPKRLENFYGRSTRPHVRYIREKKRLEYGKAHEDSYSLDLYR